ncbi:hypothetical protein [Kosakonia sp. MUSA4]|uniref:hypothetical protein n=1 Tax=Kosakonia sp. MUSA4 TaxID=2067958 RepID=UPI0015985067|nr:hypothetical protein [Kosakonia sp. MUSA4]QJT79588.1 hypothetical protein C0557_05650 [Kosakonia sp. MUSA4]
MVFPITPFHATKIRQCFEKLNISGEVFDYKTVYRDTKTNFICNVHTGRKGMSMEVQNADKDLGLAQILSAIARETPPAV